MEHSPSHTPSLAQNTPDTSSAAAYPVSIDASVNDQHDVANTAAAALLSTPPNLNQAQQPPFTSHPPTRPPARKRKPAAPGSRGVATLTPEQLAKKRANDRDAQRAIRERTKNTIEGLERRIRELENQQPYQELQRALSERDKALAECEDLRQRLAAVAGIVGNRTIGQTSLNELAALTAQQAPIPASKDQDQYQRYGLPDSHATHDDRPQQISPHTQGDTTSHAQQHLDPDLRALATTSEPIPDTSP